MKELQDGSTASNADQGKSEQGKRIPLPQRQNAIPNAFIDSAWIHDIKEHWQAYCDVALRSLESLKNEGERPRGLDDTEEEISLNKGSLAGKMGIRRKFVDPAFKYFVIGKIDNQEEEHPTIRVTRLEFQQLYILSYARKLFIKRRDKPGNTMSIDEVRQRISE